MEHRISSEEEKEEQRGGDQRCLEGIDRTSLLFEGDEERSGTEHIDHGEKYDESARNLLRIKARKKIVE